MEFTIWWRISFSPRVVKSAVVFLSIRVVFERQKSLWQTMYQNTDPIHSPADTCCILWKRKSEAIDTLLAPVVFIKLQCVGGAGLVVVPFL